MKPFWRIMRASVELMYSLFNYGSMIASKVRMDAYTEALRRAVKPGSVVVDIGTGTGILAMLACRFGARQVYAIEADDVIQVARETAAINCCSDRIQFIQDLSTRINLPEQADVIVSDLHGVLPAYLTSLSSIADAQRRWLAPGGNMIPLRETLWAAAVDAPKVHETYVVPWKEETHGFQMQNIRNRVMQTWKKELLPESALVTTPQCWGVLNYDRLENPHICGSVSWTIDQERMAHGLGIWFDSVMFEGVGFSNAPGQPEVIFGRAFCPWPEPVSLRPGDLLSVAIQDMAVGDDYVCTWKTKVVRDGQVAVQFHQSTFSAEPLSAEKLRKRAMDYLPKLSTDGEVKRFVLTRMDGQSSVETISSEVHNRFREHFPTLEEARKRVSDLSQRFSQ